jgi:hypothetical protein
MAPPYLQVVALCFFGGVLGLAAMIPLRRMLLVEGRQELPYPEGTGDRIGCSVAPRRVLSSLAEAGNRLDRSSRAACPPSPDRPAQGRSPPRRARTLTGDLGGGGSGLRPGVLGCGRRRSAATRRCGWTPTARG